MKISAGSAASTAAEHLPRASRHEPTATPAGSGNAHRPADQRHPCARAERRCAIAWPCLPEERLAMKRTGSIGSCVGPEVTSTCRPASGPCAPRRRLARSGQRQARSGPPRRASIAATIASGSAMRPGPYSPQAISPSSGPTKQHAVRAQLRDIALRRRMQPHPHVHRRGDQHPLVGREQRGRGEIVGEALRHPGQQIGGRRRDDDEIGVARQFDMAHLGFVGQREQVVVDLVAAERGGRQRRDELLGRRPSSRRARWRRARAGGGSARAPCRRRCRRR